MACWQVLLWNRLQLPEPSAALSRIPNTFTTTAQYKTTFELHIIEEVRAAIQQSVAPKRDVRTESKAVDYSVGDGGLFVVQFQLNSFLSELRSNDLLLLSRPHPGVHILGLFAKRDRNHAHIMMNMRMSEVHTLAFKQNFRRGASFCVDRVS